MSWPAEELNHDAITVIGTALAQLDKVDAILTGELAVTVYDQPVGYITLHGESEATFTQRPASG